MSDEKSDCVFCRIVSGSEPAQVILENEHSLSILDINPLAQGHCLVIPKRHVPWWHQLTAQENASLFTLARAASKRIMKVFSPEFVTMYARGRRIPHTHIFLIPTFKGDPTDRHFNALEGFQEQASTLAGLRDRGVLYMTAELLRKGKGKKGNDS
ncbi:MAG: HIT family protein [Desulfobacterota bacterium]|jgi:histidine triad (HIT) family protein|nr:HIT family protein [Thermodesulfobacteriota bacterium]